MLLIEGIAKQGLKDIITAFLLKKMWTKIKHIANEKCLKNYSNKFHFHWTNFLLKNDVMLTIKFSFYNNSITLRKRAYLPKSHLSVDWFRKWPKFVFHFEMFKIPPLCSYNETSVFPLMTDWWTNLRNKLLSYWNQSSPNLKGTQIFREAWN